MRYNPANLAYLSAKIVPGEKEIIIASLESIWKKLDPAHPLEWKMMEDEIDDAYRQAGFIDILNIVGYISVLAVTLACLGMLGMAMYSTQTRMKEIGVRKVMGASAEAITMLLSTSFLWLLGISALVAIPIGYFFGAQFLDTYAYKIEITPLLILSAVSIVGLLGIATICSQTWKAASSDPVKTLRYE